MVLRDSATAGQDERESRSDSDLADARSTHNTGVATALRRVVVIVNPATRGDPEAIIDILSSHAPENLDLDIHLTTAAGSTTSLTRQALAGGADVAVAVGGDGTVAAVATALRGTGIPLGIIPAGSTNITAQEFGIPNSVPGAVALLFGAHRHALVDVGLCGEDCFLHMAGAGLDSRMFAGTNALRKREIGWLAYVPPALHELRHPLMRFTITTDGVTRMFTSPLVLVANGSSIITPGLWLYPGIRTDDGWLDVLVFTPAGPVQIARTLGRLATHGLGRSRYVTRLRARRIDIASDPPLPVELDGDVITSTPVTLTVAPSALNVIVPWNTTQNYDRWPLRTRIAGSAGTRDQAW